MWLSPLTVFTWMLPLTCPCLLPTTCVLMAVIPILLCDYSITCSTCLLLHPVMWLAALPVSSKVSPVPCLEITSTSLFYLSAVLWLSPQPVFSKLAIHMAHDDPHYLRSHNSHPILAYNYPHYLCYYNNHSIPTMFYGYPHYLFSYDYYPCSVLWLSPTTRVRITITLSYNDPHYLFLLSYQKPAPPPCPTLSSGYWSCWADSGITRLIT